MKYMYYKLQKGTKMSFRRTNNIEILSEQLESLQITEEASSKYKQTDTEMFTALAPAPVNKNV